jgi:hypothetical protein
MNKKENQSVVDFIEMNFWTEANIYNGFSEDDRWTISEDKFMRIIINARKLEADIATAMYEKGKSDGYDFATSEAIKAMGKMGS